MTKMSLGALASIATSIILFGTQATAQSTIPIAVSAAYSKGNSQYDLVVKGTPGTKLVLYVNDKHPSYSTINKKDWATFHKVTLDDANKLSFTKQLKGKNDRTYQRPINYVRYVHISNGAVSFTNTQGTTTTNNNTVQAPAPATTPSPTNDTVNSRPSPTPTQTTAPAPSSCTPLTNGGNCYEPGEYCRNSDHGASGIAGNGEAITCTDNNGWRWEPS